MSLSEIVLSKKREKSQEYTLHLFEHCNLTCNFCWQNHNDRIGVDTVRDKIPTLLGMIEKDPSPAITLNIMGGEIFSDIILTESLVEDFMTLIRATRDYCDANNKTLSIIWVTNLVFSNVDLVKKLLQQCDDEKFDYCLSTSYDSAGRFNVNTFMTWRRNLEIFKPWLRTISVLLTKPNMRGIMNSDPQFDKLYNEGHYIYFDYYMPDSDWEKIGPTDKDLLEFFYFLIDKYPKVHPMNEWMTSGVNPLSCRSSRLLLSDGTVCMCGNLLDQKVIQWYDSKIHKNSNQDIEGNFINRMGCLTCEYFDRCQLGCFVQHDFSLRRDLDECVFKLTFDKILAV